MSAIQCAAHAEIGRSDEAHEGRDDKHAGGVEITRQRQRQQRGGEHRIGGAHHGEQIAVTDAVAQHPEQRRDQRAGVVERGKQRQQQHRSGLDQHVPAQDDRLHLESRRRQKVGRPLETVIPDAEGRERGRPRQAAQISMPRLIALHPALFLVVAANGPPGRRKRTPGQPVQRNAEITPVNQAGHSQGAARTCFIAAASPLESRSRRWMQSSAS